MNYNSNFINALMEKNKTETIVNFIYLEQFLFLHIFLHFSSCLEWAYLFI